MNWLDEFFGWDCVVGIIVAGPLILIVSLTHGMWGYAVFGALFSVFGALVAKWVFGKRIGE